MKKPYQITIQIPLNVQTDEISQLFRRACQKENLLLKIICFPSNGPLGQQMRVITTNRLKFDPLTHRALTLIDKMDYFFPPISVNDEINSFSPDLLLVIEEVSHLSPAGDSDLDQWEKEINAILPQSDLTLIYSSPQQENDTEDAQSQSFFREAQTGTIHSQKDIDRLILTVKKEINRNA